MTAVVVLLLLGFDWARSGQGKPLTRTANENKTCSVLYGINPGMSEVMNYRTHLPLGWKPPSSPLSRPFLTEQGYLGREERKSFSH